MIKMKVPRKWYVVIVGLDDWRENAKVIPMTEFNELKDTIDNFLSKTFRLFRQRGAIVGSLLWSHENLAPMFLLEATRMNDRFLKEQRIIMGNVEEKILAGLTHEERESNLGNNIQSIALKGKMLILDCSIPFDAALYPGIDEIAMIFRDAFNAELLTIKRAENDFTGRKNWLASIENVLNRHLIQDVGPVKKIREAKEVEAKKLYDKKSPGDFEKIVRILAEAVPYRPSLFEIEKPTSSLESNESLGHLIIFYLSTEGDFPVKLTNRSVLFDRLGRKSEIRDWIDANNVNWKDLDKLMVYLEQIAYDQIEKVLIDVGAIKFDGFWTERDLSNNIYFLSNFSFTEDILKQLRKFITNPREQIEKHISYNLSQLFDLWQKAGLHYNMLIFEVKAFDLDEEKKLIEWIKKSKAGQVPGPNYSSEKETLVENHYRPF